MTGTPTRINRPGTCIVDRKTLKGWRADCGHGVSWPEGASYWTGACELCIERLCSHPRFGGNKYQCVLLDPPWAYSGSQSKQGAAGNHYETMSDDEIFALELPLISPGVVFVWATGPKLHTAIDAIRAWGLHYRGVGFCWIKTRKDGTPIGAQGVRPSIVKPLTEFVLVGSTKKSGRPLPLASEKIVQTVFAPKGAHSAKPVEVMDRIDEMYPDLRKLEMFARGRAHGELWDVWGDQAVAA